MKLVTVYSRLSFLMLLSFGLTQQDSTKKILIEQIGPIINDLPLLDSLLVNSIDSLNLKSEKAIGQFSDINTFPMNASGTFFRGIEMSSQGTGSLNGGLRIQIAGKLSESVQVSGIVTDESIPIQPDGTTAALEELDKVYIKVSHPSNELTAGDITVINNSGKYNNNKRNIVGIRNNFNNKNMSLKTIIGQSKGKYNRLEIKGKDGNQGPYFLTSKTNARNVVISSGSEKVWLNGAQLKRGQDQDYTIDYSAAEITFTAKNLIYFDSDIDIEYQYSQSNYKSSFVQATLKSRVGKKSTFSISYIDERDNKSSSFITQNQKNIFKSKDIIQDLGSISDSLGEYRLINGVYIYNTDFSQTSSRYKVIFGPDPSGTYVRKISSQNRIYYEFISLDIIDNSQRYSPGRSISPPVSQQLLQFDSIISPYGGLSIISEGALSIYENNIYSNRNSSKLNGSAFQFLIEQETVEFRKVKFGLDLKHWQNGSEFRSLGRDRNVNFNESWDIYSKPKQVGRESLSSIMTKINIGENIVGDIDFSQLSQGNQIKNRSEVNFNYSGNYINTAQVRYNKVNAILEFQEIDGHIRFFKGAIKPFLTIIHEMRENYYRFDDIMVGIEYKKNNRYLSFGVGEREDKESILSDSTILKTTKVGKILQLDFNSIQPSGWGYGFMGRQRIQEDSKGEIINNFSSFRGTLNYRKKASPFQLDFVVNAKEGSNESRAVVYDSVGVGLGHYRYDNLLNEYISDMNGSFVAHTVFTGNYKSGFLMDGLNQFSIDFSKWKYESLNNLKYRLMNRLDFYGDKLSILGDNNNNIQFHRQFIRHELILRKSQNTNRNRIWFQDALNINGMDPRGWDERSDYEWGIESQVQLKKNKYFIFSGDVHNAIVKSEKNWITERSVKGFTSEVGIKEIQTGITQWETKLVYYKDATSIGENSNKDVNAYGIKINFIRFIGKTGRIEGQIQYMNANAFNSMPPEALNGLSDNRTFRTNINGSLMISKSLSINSSLMFLNDERYDNFIKLQGEVRAYF
mgnify:FL=1